ncbi:DUF6801 domain-containing protein [Amycolatopsis sp. H20-H5]|uniref:DUF6801 domain-containing protein n=1 Tax=Amycolatopsis sp. H20-H5 TaxID=3046309 RepID=UPI002DBFCC68|nr:DUF6801 domain-containing protein [Amycolatopsis sp. H20-H5]MEC3978411.1 DUF6801 domain-containing protein [Amycolatopsis sp. H20-H5]
MSHRRGFKKLAAVAAATTATGLVAAGLIVGAQVSSADPVSLTLTYKCEFPIVGVQPLKVAVTTDLPLTVPVNTPTGAFAIKAVSTISEDTVSGLGIIGATTLEGTAGASASVVGAGINLPSLTVPVTLDKTNIPASGEMAINANGKTPSLTFKEAGDVKINVGGLSLKVTPRKADGTVTDITPDGTISTACTQDPGQNNLLATIKVGSGPASSTPPTSPTTPTTPTSPSTQPTTPTSDPTTPTTPGGGTIKYSYAIDGQTTLKSLGSTAPIKGSFDADVKLQPQTFTGNLTLANTHTDFKLLGFLPGSSDIKVVQEGVQSGELVAPGFKAHIKFNVFLPQVALFGFPISTDPKCGTVSPSTSEMVTAPDFNLLKGGKLSGTYSLSALANCGGLNDYISAFAKSDGNTLDLNLTKK